ncbi:CDP-diacylglycerol--glycerol-3-phosphate 3-phosphatidyltransferase [Devosia rhodophyticola]|uniref:CDP-diacylglycerol--glycerol-3-phosphate 3-phosphatidyltransferase n=1 Tax=Devosia rhodophyticola TaxID=3026423 RepID=A0ABY7YV06_9HYPH|nr:CDP-diacylglycerol--glycerol-3-phosphate 3-phosphatidyltransferase [Devosia rhodophyticola]WDR05086.1 CDP-diacylglycerol--glycerol-3-phosphate 3-phosphatidyltransferase [Devosia rhodophyticola]
MANASQITSIPNLITIARIVAIPVIAWLVIMADPGLRLFALVLYVLAAASDWVDGYLARKWNQTSPLGRMLDPIADKLLVGVMLVVLAYDHTLSALDLIPACTILFREIFISGLREFLGNTKVVLPVSMLAKWKTTTQLIAIAILLLVPAMPVLDVIGTALIWLAAVLTLWTGIQYFRASWPHLSGDTP